MICKALYFSTKEKKFFQENNNKAAEEVHQAQDKVNHLNMVKNKLESTLDDLEDTLDREKKQRGDTEKHRRKVEADLKISQDMVGELERGKKELDAVVSRRDREILEIAAKLEEEQAGDRGQGRGVLGACEERERGTYRDFKGSGTGVFVPT